MNAPVSQTHHISQDMDAPFGVHLGGRLVAEFKTEAESNAYLSHLVNYLRTARAASANA